MEELINVINATKYSPGSIKNAAILKDINIKIKTGDFIAVTGPVRVEKTALLRLLCLRDKPDTGSLFFTGIDTGTLPHSLRKNLLRYVFGTVFQEDAIYFWLSVQKNVALHLHDKKPKEAFIKSHEILKEFGIEKIENKKAGELTDEQKKMAVIARAVAAPPSIIIADELTDKLTEENSRKIINYLRKINEDNKTTIIIASNDDLITRSANRIIRL
jgi:ABC-type lipoprotein export system ATPase subunit